MSQQSSNVLFGQSRNVLLTPADWRGAGRTATDEPNRPGPVGGLEKGQEEIDHAEGGCEGIGNHGKAGEATIKGVATTRR